MDDETRRDETSEPRESSSSDRNASRRTNLEDGSVIDNKQCHFDEYNEKKAKDKTPASE